MAKTVSLRDDLIKPLPPQLALLNAMWDYEYTLFGGAAGGGKSFILRWACLELLCEWALAGHKNVCVGLFCEDYPTLEDRQIAKIKREFPLALGELRKTQEEGFGFFLRPQYGGGYIALRNLDDPSKYASSEFAGIAVDELTKNARQTFDDLRFRKRWPGIEHSPFIAASNPGSKGHAWVRKLWIDEDFSGDDSELDPKSFRFIPSRAGENPYLPKSYMDTLASLPPQMRKAMLEGSWDVYEGQYFEEWDASIHVCTEFEVPPSWKRIVAIDYGYEAPSAVLWCAVDHSGHWWIYRELYQRRLNYAELGNLMLELTPIEESFSWAVADPAIWGDRPMREENPGITGGDLLTDILSSRGINLLRANHSRVPGWHRIRDLMRPRLDPQGKRYSMLHIFPQCKALIRTLPSMVYASVGSISPGNRMRLEDLDTNSEDHCVDALRYALNSIAEPGYAQNIPVNFDHMVRY